MTRLDTGVSGLLRGRLLGLYTSGTIEQGELTAQPSKLALASREIEDSPRRRIHYVWGRIATVTVRAGHRVRIRLRAVRSRVSMRRLHRTLTTTHSVA